MTQPQARVVKPRSRTRLIPPSSRAWGPTPASRMSHIRATLAQLLSKLRTASECSAASACLRFLGAILLSMKRASNQRGARSQLLDLIFGSLEFGLRARLRADKETPRRRGTYQVDYTFRMDGSFYRTPGAFWGTWSSSGWRYSACRRWVLSVDHHLPHMSDSAEYFWIRVSGGDIHKGARTRPPRATIFRGEFAFCGGRCARRALASPAVVPPRIALALGRSIRTRVLVSPDHESNRVRSGRIGWPR